MTLASFIFSSSLMVLTILATGFSVHLALNKVTRNEVFYYSAVPILGIVAYSLYLFLAGYFVGLSTVILLAPLLLLVLCLPGLKQAREGVRSFLNTMPAFKISGIYYLCFFVIILFSFMRVFGTRVLNDSLVYHLYLPKEYIANGHIFKVPFSEHALWPQLVEMFALFGLSFSGVAAAKFFSFFVLVCIWAFTYLLIKIVTSDAPLAFLGSVVLLATPAYFFYAADVYVDLTLALFALAAVYFLYRYYCCHENIITLVIAAIACAGALSCKYIAIILLLSISALMIIMAFKEKKAYLPVLFMVVCCIFASPWYVRSYLESGNPIFPFAYQIFGKGFETGVSTPDMTLLGRLIHTGAASGFGAGNSLVSLLALPFNITFKSAAFGGERVGYIYLLLLPFFIYSFFVKGSHKYIGVFIGLFVIQWFFLGQCTRYLFPVFPLYVCVSLAAAKNLLNRVKIRNAFLGIVAPVLIFQSAWSGYYFYQDFEYLFRSEPREQYLDPSYRLGQFLKAQPIKDGKVLLVGEAKVFYLPGNVIREKPFKYFTRYDTQTDRIAVLRNNGIKYVLLNKDYMSDKDGIFDAAAYFKSELSKNLSVMAAYKDADEFLLCRVITR